MQVMKRAQSNSPRLPPKNQHSSGHPEETQVLHFLPPDHTPSHMPTRPPSYPAAAPSHAQRERAEVQLRQQGSSANVPRIRVSCEPDLGQFAHLYPGQEGRGRTPGRSFARESEVERQTPFACLYADGHSGSVLPFLPSVMIGTPNHGVLVRGAASGETSLLGLPSKSLSALFGVLWMIPLGMAFPSSPSFRSEPVLATPGGPFVGLVCMMLVFQLLLLTFSLRSLTWRSFLSSRRCVGFKTRVGFRGVRL